MADNAAGQYADHYQDHYCGLNKSGKSEERTTSSAEAAATPPS
jgi:hypothetical protein